MLMGFLIKPQEELLKGLKKIFLHSRTSYSRNSGRSSLRNPWEILWEILWEFLQGFVQKFLQYCLQQSLPELFKKISSEVSLWFFSQKFLLNSPQEILQGIPGRKFSRELLRISVEIFLEMTQENSLAFTSRNPHGFCQDFF